jgi:hypothetical protein
MSGSQVREQFWVSHAVAGARSIKAEGVVSPTPGHRVARTGATDRGRELRNKSHV